MVVTHLGDMPYGQQEMQEFAAHIELMEDSEAILEFTCARCRESGADGFSYHFTPIFESATSRNTFVWARHAPPELQTRYFSEGFREINPVPKLAQESGPLMTSRQARELGKHDAQAASFFQFFEEIGIEHWAGFHLFGPRARNALAALTFDKDFERLPVGTLTYIHSMLQAAHFRICAIIAETEREVSLSEREKEVLRGIGAGMSAQEVARKLQISPETVKTYTKRIYEKLETHDRVTATVRALKLGLVEL